MVASLNPSPEAPAKLRPASQGSQMPIRPLLSGLGSSFLCAHVCLYVHLLSNKEPPQGRGPRELGALLNRTDGSGDQ